MFRFHTPRFALLKAGYVGVCAGYEVALKVFPDKSYIDAAHIAFCCVHGIELIASWNFKHIASPWARQRITTALESLNLFSPLIATPDELLEGV